MSSERDNQLPPGMETANPFKEHPVEGERPVVEAEIANDEVELSSERKPSGNQRLGRLHPLSLGFDILSHVRSLIIPAGIAVLSAAQGSVTGLIFAGLIFIPTLITSAIKYFSLRYQILDDELIVSQGVFFQRDRTVPVERIQNIDLVQNVLHRLFGVAEVRIETASGTEAEATLRVLSMAKVEQLRNAIFKSAQVAKPIKAEDANTPADVVEDHQISQESETLLSIPASSLIRAGLASNKGNILLGVLFGLYFQFDEQVTSVFDFKKTIENFTNNSSTNTVVFVSIAAALFLFILFRLLGIAWYLLRFQGYQLTLSGEDLRIQCGLFTRVSATVPRKRIQFISIHRNLLMRWMNLAAIRIETAGGSSQGNEDATKSVSSRWFVPVVPNKDVKRLVEQLRPGLQWEEDSMEWKGVSPKANRRLTRMAIVLAVLTGLVGLAIYRPWGWLFGLGALPLYIWIAWKRSQSKKYARNQDIIVYRSGVFTRKTSLTFFEKIQTVRLDQSPFDRRWNMATLCIDTAAAGPADHRIDIKYLSDDFAQQEFDSIVQQASGKLPVFG